MKHKAAAEPLVSSEDDGRSFGRTTRGLLSSSGLQVEGSASSVGFLQSERMEETRGLVRNLSILGIGGIGLQVLPAENGWRILIVLLSARAREEEERQAMRAGAASFLSKPVDKTTLLGGDPVSARIRAQLARRRQIPSSCTKGQRRVLNQGPVEFCRAGG